MPSTSPLLDSFEHAIALDVMRDPEPASEDVVVTVPMGMWQGWLAEGDRAGEAPGGMYDLYHYVVGRRPGDWIKPGCRVYVVAHGRLRGYAPLHSIEPWDERSWSLVRQGGAVACTVAQEIPGFRGIRRAEQVLTRDQLVPFPDWQTAGIR